MKNIDKKNSHVLGKQACADKDVNAKESYNKNSVKVSIICITYNQEKYLRRALDSMLSQVTNFSYEILLHDDVSTDGTVDILHEYEEKYPNIIRVIYESENQYSKGVDFVANMVKNVARGKYIALCEGDDFWIDDHKLQIQYEALESHLECDMCACWGSTVTEDGTEEVSDIQPKNHDCILPVEDVIKGGGQYLVTAGLFYRRSMYDVMLPFEKVIPLDYAQQIKGALRYGIYYINKKMAVYRRYAGGSWTNNVLKNKERLKVQWSKEIALLKQLDVDTNGKYHAAIEERLKSYIPFEDQLEEHTVEIQKMLEGLSGKLYIWGRGRRGASLEEYCKKHQIAISGICDVINTNIGMVSDAGNIICHTDDVKRTADVIFASNRYAYDDLTKDDLDVHVLDFEQYMPWG